MSAGLWIIYIRLRLIIIKQRLINELIGNPHSHHTHSLTCLTPQKHVMIYNARLYNLIINLRLLLIIVNINSDILILTVQTRLRHSQMLFLRMLLTKPTHFVFSCILSEFHKKRFIYNGKHQVDFIFLQIYIATSFAKWHS